MTEEFRLGFVEGCLAANCDRDETEELFKIAYVSQMFDTNKDFIDGFTKVASDFDTEKISLMGKALLLESAIKKVSVSG